MNGFIWLLVFLGICTYTDIRERKIYLGLCMFNGIAGLGINLFRKEYLFIEIMAGVILGLAFLFVSFCTKERIGFGDSMVILTMGCIVGGENSFCITLWAFLFCTLASLFEVLFLKKKMNYTLPLMPFMLLGAIATVITQKI